VVARGYELDVDVPLLSYMLANFLGALVVHFVNGRERVPEVVKVLVRLGDRLEKRGSISGGLRRYVDVSMVGGNE